MHWGNRLFPLMVIAAFTITAYSNFLHNSFQLDDYNTIVKNTIAQNPKNIPLFFKSATAYSIDPPNQVYRPLLTSIFALAAALGGLNPLLFHIIGLLAYIVLGVLIFFFFRNFFGESNFFAPIFATLWFLLLPANTEAVNYINQNSEIFALITVIGSFILYIYKPTWRKYYLYLIPFLAGGFIKISTIVFAPLLFAYAFMVENKTWKESLKTALPSFLAGGVIAIFVLSMNAPTVVLSNISRFQYLISQFFVIPHYLISFFLPISLSVDYGWPPAASLADPRVLLGLLILVLIIYAAYKLYRNPKTKIAAFGIIWFFVSLSPTSSLVPFSEIGNDHRPFFAYVGLILTIGYIFFAKINFEKNKKLILAILSLFLIYNGFLTYRANATWLNTATLWQNALQTNPRNERALLNYGVSQIDSGNYENAKQYFEKVKSIDPNYVFVYINLGMVDDFLNDEVGAETNFKQAVALAGNYPDPYAAYGIWLYKEGRFSDAEALLEPLASIFPSFLPPHYILTDIYLRNEDEDKANKELGNLLALNPNDKIALGFSNAATNRNALLDSEVRMLVTSYKNPTANDYINLGLFYYQAKLFSASIEATKRATELDPTSAIPYNNIGAAYKEMGNLAEAKKYFEKALSIDPNLAIAKNNLRLLEQNQ